MNIYVGNLSYEVTGEDLQKAFEVFGHVESAKVIKDMYTDRSKGFGFVEMSTESEAQAAIDDLNDTALKGQNLKVSKARPRTGGRQDREKHGGGWRP